ncbi:MAG: class I SAM-dependent methyltransferase [Acidimicrobiia bacterium]
MENHFDEDVAERYDESTVEMFDPTVVGSVVDFIAEQARRGAALEFGVGTGRIAIPLAAKGVPLTGIDLSQAMIDRLQAKPGGRDIEVVVGDMTSTRATGVFSVVFLVFNTIMNLTTQSEQVACLRNAASHLGPGGRFIVEVMVPALRLLPPGQRHVVFHSDEGEWGIDEYNVVTQGLISHHIEVVDAEVRRHSIPFRYVWPSELDLMAEMAGMRLRERYATWSRGQFTHESRQHVSVWEKLA